MAPTRNTRYSFFPKLAFPTYPGAALCAASTASLMSFLLPSATWPITEPVGENTGRTYGASGRRWAPPIYTFSVRSILVSNISFGGS